jgi:hypothetical protein
MIVMSEQVNMQAPIYSDANSRAIPGAYIDNSTMILILHLTRGSQYVKQGIVNQNVPQSFAIDFSAYVPVKEERGDNPGDWDINFIQLIYQPVLKLTYAGADPEDGSIVKLLTEPVPQWRLDAIPAKSNGTPPFPHNKPKFRIGATGPDPTRYGNSFGDHPNAQSLFLIQPNLITGRDNYLIRAQKVVHFFTAFVARDRLGRRSTDYIPLAYVQWFAIWDFGIKYYGGNPPKSMDKFIIGRQFWVGNVVKQYPPADMARMIERPTTNDNEMYAEINADQVDNAFYAKAINRNNQPFTYWLSDHSASFVS